MKHIPSILIAWLLAAAVAACLTSQSLYGQQHLSGPQQRGLNQTDAVQVWREAAVRGLSYNEALAMVRLRQKSTVPTPLHPRFQVGAGATLNRPGGRVPYAANTPFPSNVSQARVGKPFDNVRPAPTAFERYWPLMLEGREDPKTGVIIWSLP